ncbi:NarK [Desulforapulum autotrophicum HRM2]|uniref:NarK n=1 Tax=Desulforapulum autotrophicum (strain ATCC 43914 / DSM 3382 / VKM B-1955 / HRM2) TaxID=177437 RepID=C0Q927_DESAH|nr:MFS transporter [Desulforapulum autotrophicum]ACN16532.1 NarK [Desulforapulum autotrophicum HRM2]
MKNDIYPTDDQQKPFRRHLGAIVFLAAIFFLNFIARVIPAPLLPSIEKDMQISHSVAGSFFLFISAGYFISLAGSGFVSSRLTHRKTIILSCEAVGLALLCISVSQNLWTIRPALTLLGLAAGLYLPSGIASITHIIDSKHWGKALAIHELAPNSGFMLAPILAEIISIWFSWRGVLAVLGVSSLCLGIAYAHWGRGGRFAGQSPDLHSMRRLGAEPGFWIMMLLFSLAIGSTMGIYTMLPLYLVVERGIDQGWANTLVGLSRISSLGMAFLSGFVSDRFGTRMTMIWVFFLTGVTTLALGMATGDWVIMFVFLQPMVAVCFFPPGFAALSAIGPPETRNVAVSMTIPLAFFIGGGIFPALIGFLGDMGKFPLGMELTGGLILCGTGVAYFLKLPAR